MKTLQYKALLVYSFLVDLFHKVQAFIWSKYNDVEMLVLNESIVEIFFYDFVEMERITLRDNTSPFRLGWLFMKRMAGCNLRPDTCLSPLTFVACEGEPGIFEIVYYENRKRHAYFTKYPSIYDRNQLLTRMLKPNTPKYLCATVNDTTIVTKFVNDHVSSFHSGCGIKAHELRDVLEIKGIHAKGDVEHVRLSFIEDETLNQLTYKETDDIVLIRDA